MYLYKTSLPSHNPNVQKDAKPSPPSPAVPSPAQSTQPTPTRSGGDPEQATVFTFTLYIIYQNNNNIIIITI